MVPILNNIGTDVACVGVSTSGNLNYLADIDCCRTMTSTLAFGNFATLRGNVIFHGYLLMY